MKTFNVLSIDWDYFIDASLTQRMMLFPDGGNENLSIFLANIIWATRYADNNELAEIKVDVDELAKLKLALLFASTPVSVVVDSHKHLYDMIERFNSERLPLNIVNIDFHHDCYGDADKEAVDCGNWALKALQPGDACLTDYFDESSFTWVSREDSDTDDYDEGEYPWAKRVVGIESVAPLNNEWDIIFLCRSGVWSPPHIDEAFADLADCVQMASEQTIVQDDIQVSRYNDDMKEQIQQHRDMIDQLKKGVANG